MRETSGGPSAGFDGMAGEERVNRLLDRALALAAQPQWSTVFWERFAEKAAAARAVSRPEDTPDALSLLRSHAVYLEDLFQDAGDAEGLKLLRAIERQGG